MSKYSNNIDAAIGKKKASLVLKNAYIVNVFNKSIEKNDIAIVGETIVGVGKYDGEKEIDCTGLFVSPGFIDSHVHIESSMASPVAFSEAVLKNGVTTVIADPHEIANVMGIHGINYMIKESEICYLDIYFMIPSSVPAVDFEDNGATINSQDVSKLLMNPGILGLGEVMNVNGVINKDEEVLKKIEVCENSIIDGHCPQISEKMLNAYISCGIYTDHECSSYDEALKKIQKGMYVIIREGSGAKNLVSLIPAINKDNYHRFLFCTDDRHMNDLISYGSIDYLIRLAIEHGIDPIMAITIGTLNAAQCYGLKKLGAVAPGYLADLVIFEDLNKLKIKYVFKRGADVNNLKAVKRSEKLESTLNLSHVTESDFKIKAFSNSINVIKVSLHSLETKKEICNIKEKDGFIAEVLSEDVLKIAVLERHNNLGKKSVGFVKGLNIKNCSIAQTIAHDSHNVIVIGDNDEDMTLAVNEIINVGGGIAMVSDGKILETMKLPIGGLMTNEDGQVIAAKINKLKSICEIFGVKKDSDIFLTLSFLALPVIPELRITARGLFDVKSFKFIDLFNNIK
ncbi:MAG: ade [Clostridiaceae bacterium]|jgi:adenine deaminase|nr:ade [Clostridiaceae bacterium]